ncbi:MAG TPA: hypothetical protein VG737_17690 [Cyclobacteriaceae bacterium]|nr:hypothetical protein [Cyclobacteriaceae bacterium]
MKSLFVLVFAMLMYGVTPAQSTNDFLISGGFDFIKTDINKVFDKAQVGLEVNYFLQRKFAVGAGGEFWTRGANSFVLGARYYPKENIFVRVRGLIGGNNLALGAGYSKPIHKYWRLEAMGDIYLAHPDFALRGGVSYIINYVTR